MKRLYTIEDLLQFREEVIHECNSENYVPKLPEGIEIPEKPDYVLKGEHEFFEAGFDSGYNYILSKLNL